MKGLKRYEKALLAKLRARKATAPRDVGLLLNVQDFVAEQWQQRSSSPSCDGRCDGSEGRGAEREKQLAPQSSLVPMEQSRRAIIRLCRMGTATGCSRGTEHFIADLQNVTVSGSETGSRGRVAHRVHVRAREWVLGTGSMTRAQRVWVQCGSTWIH